MGERDRAKRLTSICHCKLVDIVRRTPDGRYDPYPEDDWRWRHLNQEGILNLLQTDYYACAYFLADTEMIYTEPDENGNRIGIEHNDYLRTSKIEDIDYIYGRIEITSHNTVYKFGELEPLQGETIDDLAATIDALLFGWDVIKNDKERTGGSEDQDISDTRPTDFFT